MSAPSFPWLTVTVDRSGKHTVVALAGELDLGSRAALDETVGDVEGSLLVDVRGLTFIDSAGVQALLDAHRRAREAGSDFRLAYDSSGPVGRVLGILGLTHVFGPPDVPLG
jgi:anti-anti-sigma factor